MIKIKEKAEDKENENIPLFEMANFSTKDSGLPLDIWINSNGRDRKVKHNYPRVKIGKNNNLIPVSICPTKMLVDNTEFKQSDVDKVLKFISDNKEIFIMHWNKQLTDMEALQALKASLNLRR